MRYACTARASRSRSSSVARATLVRRPRHARATGARRSCGPCLLWPTLWRILSKGPSHTNLPRLGRVRALQTVHAHAACRDRLAPTACTQAVYSSPRQYLPACRLHMLSRHYMSTIVLVALFSIAPTHSTTAVCAARAVDRWSCAARPRVDSSWSGRSRPSRRSCRSPCISTARPGLATIRTAREAHRPRCCAVPGAALARVCASRGDGAHSVARKC